MLSPGRLVVGLLELKEVNFAVVVAPDFRHSDFGVSRELVERIAAEINFDDQFRRALQ
jgi:hypothetical protein